MPHMVVYRNSDGSPGYHQADSLEEAVRRVEHLRNEEQVSETRIFRMEEVPIEFKPYYRVEIGGTELSSGPPPAQAQAAPAPAPAQAPAPSAPAPSAPAPSTPAPDTGSADSGPTASAAASSGPAASESPAPTAAPAPPAAESAPAETAIADLPPFTVDQDDPLADIPFEAPKPANSGRFFGRS